jgi:peptidoglycan/LPS O-acetylase OafA/YrhL
MPAAAAVALDPTRARMPATRKVVGLDTLRFACALVVMVQHIQLLPFRVSGAGSTPFRMVLSGIYNCLFNGPAAVIVFFIVSGFCINFPYRNGRPVPLASFYCRRFIRIVLPASVFYLIRTFVIRDTTSLQQSVLWSIVCETVYYALFPVLLFLRRRSNWLVLLGCSAIAAAALLGTHWSWLSDGDYIALGWLTWVIGLPCWILGCWLSETYHSFPLLSSRRIWLSRVFIYGLSVALYLARFHIRSNWVSSCILLDMFALPAVLWVGCEIVYAGEHTPVAKLEWAGSWSYSLYLVHPLVGPVLGVIGLSFLDSNPGTHFLLLLLAPLLGYAFYRTVELPSHRLAVASGRAVEGGRVPDLKKAAS